MLKLLEERAALAEMHGGTDHNQPLSKVKTKKKEKGLRLHLQSFFGGNDHEDQGKKRLRQKLVLFMLKLRLAPQKTEI